MEAMRFSPPVPPILIKPMDQSTETPAMQEISISPTDAELCCSALEDAIGDLEAAKKRRKEGLTPSERTLARLYRSTRQTLRGKMDRDQVDDHGYRILRHNREVEKACVDPNDPAFDSLAKACADLRDSDRIRPPIQAVEESLREEF